MFRFGERCVAKNLEVVSDDHLKCNGSDLKSLYSVIFVHLAGHLYCIL